MSPAQMREASRSHSTKNVPYNMATVTPRSISSAPSCRHRYSFQVSLPAAGGAAEAHARPGELFLVMGRPIPA